MTTLLKHQFGLQVFSNGYDLVDGDVMNAAHGSRFQVPPAVLKRHIGVGHFVEVRIDSPRFSVHEGDVEGCTCPSCNGVMSKPVLSHNHPVSLVDVPPQNVPSRGWGEDFWVQITEREDEFLKGVVDNTLVEARLHGVSRGHEIILRETHVLAVHNSHRAELVSGMNADELKALVLWLGSMND